MDKVAASTSEPIFRIDGLTKIYHSGEVEVRALNGVTLELYESEMTVLLGPSGSGKTTVGRAITKLVQPTGGRLLFDGADMAALHGNAALRPYRRRVQMIFQDAYQALNPRHTVFDAVAEPADRSSQNLISAAVSAASG